MFLGGFHLVFTHRNFRIVFQFFCFVFLLSFTGFIFFIKCVNFSQIHELLSILDSLFQISLKIVLNAWNFLIYVIDQILWNYPNYKLFSKSLWAFFNPCFFHFLWIMFQITSFYGLKQAPRAWYKCLTKFLIEKGFEIGKIDSTLFTKRVNG